MAKASLINVNEKKALMTVTDKALRQINALLAKRGKDSYGIRVGIKSGGCYGHTYYVEYADAKNIYDEVIIKDNVKILIDPKAMMYLIGTEMDYQATEFKSGFTFNNPNISGSCGCNKSFSV